MDFSFAEVELALALSYRIVEEKRGAFTAKLQNLQKLRFPGGTNTGRGRAARYTVGHLYLMGVALELSQLGLSPERAKLVIESDLHAVAMAGAMAARDISQDGQFEFPVFLYCDPGVLRYMMKPAGEEDWTERTFHYGGIGQVSENFKEWFQRGIPRMAFFSVSALLYGLARHAANNAGEDPGGFYEGIQAWADPFIHNVDYPLDRADQPYWNTIEVED